MTMTMTMLRLSRAGNGLIGLDSIRLRFCSKGSVLPFSAGVWKGFLLHICLGRENHGGLQFVTLSMQSNIFLIYPPYLDYALVTVLHVSCSNGEADV